MPNQCCLCAARAETARVKAEVMAKILEAQEAYWQETWGDVDRSLCQPVCFSPCEIEAIIHDLPMPERI